MTHLSRATKRDRPLDLIGIGECMVELSSAAPLSQASSLDVGFGGDVLNTLFMASRLGCRTGFVSRVGQDPFGQRLLAGWQQAGIDLSHCPGVPGRNGMYVISSLPDNQHEFWYYRKDSAAAGLTEADVDADYIASSRALLLSGITQAISESAQRATLHAAMIARDAGTMVFFDPNMRPGLWAERCAGSAGDALELAREAMLELLPYVDCVLPSHPSDAAAITHGAAMADHGTHASGYLDMGVELVGMKLGPAGSCVYRRGEQLQVLPFSAALSPAAQGGPVVDSTGAGDAWNAAFIQGLLGDRPLVEAAVHANRVASWKVGQQGAIPRDTTGLSRILAGSLA